MPHTKCALCKRVNAAASRFCIACGTPLNRCAACSALNPAFAAACLSCAQALPTSEADIRATAIAVAVAGQDDDDPEIKDFSWHTSPVSDSSGTHAGNREITDVSEGWAGSAPAERLSPRPRGNPSVDRAPRHIRWTLYGCVLIALVGVAYYMYRDDVSQARHPAPASAQPDTAARPAATPKASIEGVAGEPETPACRRAVAALGLCTPESNQRRE